MDLDGEPLKIMELTSPEPIQQQAEAIQLLVHHRHYCLLQAIQKKMFVPFTKHCSCSAITHGRTIVVEEPISVTHSAVPPQSPARFFVT